MVYDRYIDLMGCTNQLITGGKSYLYSIDIDASFLTSVKR